ncbi:UNVERIFIED_CONTAM: hypothetical protein GTU68_031972 [Idotea baltica]|nr:hypothetical protein [Idotea baltica]
MCGPRTLKMSLLLNITITYLPIKSRSLTNRLTVYNFSLESGTS